MAGAQESDSVLCDTPVHDSPLRRTQLLRPSGSRASLTRHQTASDFASSQVSSHWAVSTGGQVSSGTNVGWSESPSVSQGAGLTSRTSIPGQGPPADLDLGGSVHDERLLRFQSTNRGLWQFRLRKPPWKKTVAASLLLPPRPPDERPYSQRREGPSIIEVGPSFPTRPQQEPDAGGNAELFLPGHTADQAASH